MADQEKQSLLEALEVKRQQREQESQAQERMLQQLKAGENLLGQWLNFKLFGITYLVGKIKFKLLFQRSIR